MAAGSSWLPAKRPVQSYTGPSARYETPRLAPWVASRVTCCRASAAEFFRVGFFLGHPWGLSRPTGIAGYGRAPVFKNAAVTRSIPGCGWSALIAATILVGLERPLATPTRVTTRPLSRLCATNVATRRRSNAQRTSRYPASPIGNRTAPSEPAALRCAHCRCLS